MDKTSSDVFLGDTTEQSPDSLTDADTGESGMSSAVLDPLERSATTIRELRRPNGMLFTVAVGIVCLAVVFTALTSLDGRTLPGRNVWTKLWKFATAIATGPGLSHGGGYDHLPDGVSPADIHGGEPDFGDREFHTGTDTYRERHGHFP